MSDGKLVDWKSPSLNKGDGMRREEGHIVLMIDHVDRVVDPYLAGVTDDGTVIYTGLHSTLSDARQTCNDYLKALRP